MRTFKAYSPDQELLLPPSLKDWLPEGHLALLLSDLVNELDLSEIFSAYLRADGRGQPPYHPLMMVKVLLYAYCTGRPSSRKIEEATYTDVAFRVLCAGQHPDHSSLAEFRKRHLKALSNLFVQVLRLCEKTGLVKLGCIAIDGTKIKANASKYKGMTYDRMDEKEKKLKEEIDALLAQAETVDATEDKEYGKESRGDELPAVLKRSQSRLAAIRAARESLEEEAREKAQEKIQEKARVTAREKASARLEEARAKIERMKEHEQEERKTGKRRNGRPLKAPELENLEKELEEQLKRELEAKEATPDPRAQRNFTDPESRIMKSSGNKGFDQAYNAQIAVDAERQIIVAAEITDQCNDCMQLVSMVEKSEANMGRKPEIALADAGYWSESAVTNPSLEGIELYVAASREKKSETLESVEGVASEEASAKEKMEHKLKTEAGRTAYRRRKCIVEPVFGQIKEIRKFRQYSFRGKEKVGQEWKLICLTHNLLKLVKYYRTAKSDKRSEGGGLFSGVAGISEMVSRGAEALQHA